MMTSVILLRTPVERRSKTLGLYAALTYAVESLCILGLAAWIYKGGLAQMLEGLLFLFAILIMISVFMRRKEDFWEVLSSEQKKIFTK
ncbi:MAG: hypothetical protein PUK24_06580 [Elusimicrobia bacterium]|nr:hypothetical protein [Elusimicrobiota bacterium]MDY6039506.1 hypothetical protein [Elusimicrobiaceae bacterium]